MSLRPGIALLFNLYYLVILVRVVLSWIRLPTYHPFMRTVGPTVYALTEPLLKPIRKALQPYQGGSPMDFSPLLLWVGLSVLEALLMGMLRNAGV